MIFLCAGVVLIYFKNSLSNGKYENSSVYISDISISVEIADNPIKQQLGLGGRSSLSENSGMLFPYPKKTTPYFWMKGMLIPIDIIWIANNKIIGIEKNVPNLPLNTPSDKLPLYSPPVPIDYVLEVASGFSDKNNIKVGDTFNVK